MNPKRGTHKLTCKCGYEAIMIHYGGDNELQECGYCDQEEFECLTCFMEREKLENKK